MLKATDFKLAIAEVDRVLEHGEEKHPNEWLTVQPSVHAWRGSEHLKHVINTGVIRPNSSVLVAEEESMRMELAHVAARVLMALELALRDDAANT